ncbi:MAG: type II toxin-antitoxin system HicA family toxin [Prolixibacteraceae bacterium]|nr:type II toxin-antitoxin system HicA family toxin [Prolixibacteraceae bacterium]
MKLKEIIRLIENDGWYIVRQKGSHKIYKHKVKDGIVVVPDHGLNKDVLLGTENSILKQAGLK